MFIGKQERDAFVLPFFPNNPSIRIGIRGVEIMSLAIINVDFAIGRSVTDVEFQG